MKVSLGFSKVLADQITPITPKDAFRLMRVDYVPRWNVPIVDLKNEEVFITAVLEVRNVEGP